MSTTPDPARLVDLAGRASRRSASRSSSTVRIGATTPARLRQEAAASLRELQHPSLPASTIAHDLAGSLKSPSVHLRLRSGPEGAA